MQPDVLDYFFVSPGKYWIMTSLTVKRHFFYESYRNRILPRKVNKWYDIINVFPIHNNGIDLGGNFMLNQLLKCFPGFGKLISSRYEFKAFTIECIKTQVNRCNAQFF